MFSVDTFSNCFIMTPINLNSIKWKSLTVFPENGNNLVVLECETHQQAVDFLTILSNNDFAFSIERTIPERPKLTITFSEVGIRVSVVLQQDILSKYFATKKINSLTTGFDVDGSLACLDDRLAIRDLHILNLN